MKTKEEIQQRLIENKQERKQLKQQLKDLPSLEVGKWYWSKYSKWTYLLYLVSIDDTIDSCTAYGFVDGEWYSQNDINFNTDQVQATDKEVEEALIKEAKKRGFKEGVVINTANGIFNNSTIDHYDSITFDLFIYKKTELFFGSKSIFLDGKWAEIIKPKTVNLNGDYTEVQLKDVLNSQFNK